MRCRNMMLGFMLFASCLFSACGGGSISDPTYPKMTGQQTFTFVGFGMPASAGSAAPEMKWTASGTISEVDPTGNEYAGYAGTLQVNDTQNCGFSSLRVTGREMRGAVVNLVLSDPDTGKTVMELGNATDVVPLSTKDGRLNARGAYHFSSASPCAQDSRLSTGYWHTEYN